MSWASEELSGADLGDRRRNKRLVAIVEDLVAQPNESVPQASRDNAAMQGTYEFWANRRIEASSIISAHTSSTIERIKEHKVVLAIQDKTELDLGNRRRTRGIGAISNQAAKGLHLHSVLAVSESGVPLGLLEHKVWARAKLRKGKGVQKRKRAIAEKESQRWLDSLEASQNLIPPKISVITIADREADIYELFAHPRREGSHLLIRAAQNRRVKKSSGETEKLFEALRSVEPCGEKRLEQSANSEKKSQIGDINGEIYNFRTATTNRESRDSTRDYHTSNISRRRKSSSRRKSSKLVTTDHTTSFKLHRCL